MLTVIILGAVFKTRMTGAGNEFETMVTLITETKCHLRVKTGTVPEEPILDLSLEVDKVVGDNGSLADMQRVLAAGEHQWQEVSLWVVADQVGSGDIPHRHTLLTAVTQCM